MRKNGSESIKHVSHVLILARMIFLEALSTLRYRLGLEKNCKKMNFVFFLGPTPDLAPSPS